LSLFKPIFAALSCLSPSTSQLTQGAGRGDLPQESFHWPPCCAGFFREGRQSESAQHFLKKAMKTNINSEADLKNRIAQHSKQLPKIDFNRRRLNRGLSVVSLLSVIRRESAEFWNGVEVVGKWVWIQFDGKHPRRPQPRFQNLVFIGTIAAKFGSIRAEQ
jgi:hypothetical protein